MAMLVNRGVGTFLKNSSRRQISLLELKIQKKKMLKQNGCDLRPLGLAFQRGIDFC